MHHNNYNMMNIVTFDAKLGTAFGFVTAFTAKVTGFLSTGMVSPSFSEEAWKTICLSLMGGAAGTIGGAIIGFFIYLGKEWWKKRKRKKILEKIKKV